MSENNKTNEYSVVKWSFFRFLLVNWKIWITLIFIVSFFFFIGKLLHEDDFFGENLIDQKKYDITIKATRSTPNTSILIFNPLEPHKTYEIDLGVGCKLIPDVTNNTYNMTVQLFRRNYNNTYYFRLPEVKDFICYTKNGELPPNKNILPSKEIEEENKDVTSNKKETETETETEAEVKQNISENSKI